MFFDLLCYVQRLTRDSNNVNKESYQLDYGLIQVPINIQPGSAEDTILSDGRFAQTWIGYTVESGIRTGDLITISGSSMGIPVSDNRKLFVKGVENWNMGDLPHYELTLTEFTEHEPN